MVRDNESDAQGAIAQIPGGLFVLTSHAEGQRGAVLVKWVQQCSDSPLMVMVAIEKGQTVEPLIRDHVYSYKRNSDV